VTPSSDKRYPVKGTVEQAFRLQKIWLFATPRLVGWQVQRPTLQASDNGAKGEDLLTFQTSPTCLSLEQISGRMRIYQGNYMAQATASTLDQIHELLARKGYSVTELDENVLRIQEVESGISLRAVLEGNILSLSLVCMVIPAAKVTPQLMRKMLSADNGIATSHFRLYETKDGHVAITLNNFCTLQELGLDDEDDILSCVSFLLADVLHARDLIGADLQ
jgi:hypothetical protein